MFITEARRHSFNQKVVFHPTPLLYWKRSAQLRPVKWEDDVAALYVIGLVNIRPWIIASLREIPRTGTHVQQQFPGRRQNMVPARGNDVLSSSLIRGPCHSMGSQPCEPTEMGRGPDTQHSATLYGWNTFAFFTASASWRAGEEYGVSCWQQGAAQGVLETSFGNALLVLWFTCLKKISEVRNTYLIWVFWKVNLRSLAESQDGRCPIIQSLLSFAPLIIFIS